MRVLFLDFDGVLNQVSYHAPKPAWAERFPFKWVDPELTRELLPLVEEVPDFRIVISSTWRLHFSLQSLRRILLDGSDEIASRVIHTTPDLSHKDRNITRGDEVQEWLDGNKNVESYAILDDDNDFFGYQRPHFVQTDPTKGVTPHNVKQLITILQTKGL